MINEKSLSEFEKDLAASMRFRTIAVRETGDQALTRWGTDCESLVALSDKFLELAEEACIR